MKILGFICILLLSARLSAQPGYLPHMQEKDFTRITEQLKKDPDNHALIWKRLNISTPHFDLYSRGGSAKDLLFKDSSASSLQSWTYKSRIADINKLVKAKAAIKEYNNTDGVADFTFLRGKFYYLSGEYDKALADYLFALKHISGEEAKKNNYAKKQAICIAIAAWYYNPHGSLADDRSAGEEDLRTALKYIDMVSPVEFTNNFNREKAYNFYESIQDPYEYNKINLLTYLQEDTRLENYYKKLMRNQYEIFKRNKLEEDEWRKEEVKKDGYNYSTNQAYIDALRYANALADFYLQKKNYRQAEWLALQALSYFPANSEGIIIERYEVGGLYFLLNKIYQAGDLKNFDKEMSSLLDLLGGSAHGISYEVAQLGKYITERLKEHPDEPRLYLAQAIWHYKNSVGSSSQPTATNAEILALLDKAEALKLEDYRLPYARAVVYLHLEKKYERGLAAINKAISLNPASPFSYLVKHELLRKLPDQNEQEIQALNQEYIKKWRTGNYKDLSGLLKAIE